MEDSWANSGVDTGAGRGDAAAPSPAAGLDLHLELTGPRVRAALEAALRQAVQAG